MVSGVLTEGKGFDFSVKDLVEILSEKLVCLVGKSLRVGVKSTLIFNLGWNFLELLVVNICESLHDLTASLLIELSRQLSIYVLRTCLMFSGVF